MNAVARKNLKKPARERAPGAGQALKALPHDHVLSRAAALRDAV
jgi:hypothetical protein